jgi:DNA-binding GntR family transcriptional regulator
MKRDERAQRASFLCFCMPLTHARASVQLWGESGPGSHRRKDERRTAYGSGGPTAPETALQAIDYAEDGDLHRARDLLAEHIQLTHLTLEMLLPALRHAFP